MTTVTATNNTPGWYDFAATAFCGAFDAVGRSIVSLGQDLADVRNVMTHLKAFDATVSVWNAFAGRELTQTEQNTRSTLKALKGWNAVGTITSEVQKLADKTRVVAKEITVRAISDFVATATGVIGKTYEVVAFLGNELAVPFFKAIADTYKNANMQALVVGSSIRGFFAGEKVVAYLQGSGDWKSGSQDFCDLVSNVGALSLSISTLGGFGSRYTVASSAASALSQSVKYFIGKL